MSKAQKKKVKFLKLKRIPIHEVINPDYVPTKLKKVQEKSLERIRKRARIESKKYEVPLLEKFIHAYLRFYTWEEGPPTLKNLKEEFNKFRAAFMENIVLTLHFPKHIFKDLLRYKKIVNTFQLQRIMKALYPEKPEEHNVYEDIEIEEFKKMSPEERALYYKWNRVYTEYLLFHYPVSSKYNDIRPIYGCFNATNQIRGCAPGYGKMWIRLYNNKEILNRITLTPIDSMKTVFWHPWSAQKRVGTLEHFNHILYWCIDEYFATMVQMFITQEKVFKQMPLYRYIEFQYHNVGGVDLEKDVAQIFYSKKDKKLAQEFCELFHCQSAVEIYPHSI